MNASRNFSHRAAFTAVLACALAGCGPSPSKLGSSPPPDMLRPIHQWWDADRSDYWVTATEQGNKVAPEIFHYRAKGIEGLLAAEPGDGTIPLQLYWSEARRDNRNVASAAGIAQALDEGYELKATEGYILARQVPGTIPLNLYWNDGITDSATSADPETQQDLQAAGYRLIRTEGFVWPARQGR